jgi:carbon monoxide dehydrogenase subunit G
MSGRYEISYQGSFVFPVAPVELWALIERPENFEQWWGWLHDVECSDERLVTGSVLTGTIDPPVPFTMRARLAIDECRPVQRIVASVKGDIEGSAKLEVGTAERGTRAAIGWDVEMKQREMRLAARFARPVLQWGHDRVVEAAVRGFARQLTR